MTDYRYRIYKRGGMWLVRKRRKSNPSNVHGPFLGIGNAWDWIAQDVDRRAAFRHNERMRRARELAGSRAEGGRFHGADC